MRANFSGTWKLDKTRTVGDVSSCMKLLGRGKIEISLVSRATEDQLVHQYAIAGNIEVHKHVHYRVLGIRDFRYETCLRLDKKPQAHEPDHKKFGDCTTSGEWLDTHTYCITWRMRVKKSPALMRITRHLEHENCTSVEMYVETRGLKASSKNIYVREKRDDKDREIMRRMRESTQKRCDAQSSPLTIMNM
jgi:hypothetical protein